MNICIYGASSPDIDPSYFEPVEALGRAMVQKGFGLVFGGGAQGLMGAAVRGVIAEVATVWGSRRNFLTNPASCRKTAANSSIRKPCGNASS